MERDNGHPPRQSHLLNYDYNPKDLSFLSVMSLVYIFNILLAALDHDKVTVPIKFYKWNPSKLFRFCQFITLYKLSQT